MTITLDAIEEEIRNVARQNPEFIYTSQRYLKKARMAGTPRGGEASYLGSVSRPDYEWLQDNGHIATTEDYDSAVVNGRLGQRCIVGQALHNLGVDDTLLEEFEGESAENVVRAAAKTPVDSRPRVGRWADKVQGAQDTGATWEEAIEEADEEWGLNA